MTNEEAKTNLEKLLLLYDDGMIDFSEIRESVKVAIEALRNSPTQMPVASDLISRCELFNRLANVKDLGEAFAVIQGMPTEESQITFCKDCTKHNKARGYFCGGTLVGAKDCCPLVEIRGRAQGHEFDYQYCAYAERRTDG